MKLSNIKIDQLTDPSSNLNISFVEIPFLYTPVLKELKRKESLIKKIYFTINSEMLLLNGVILSILRLFDIPEYLVKEKDKVILNYTDKTIEVEFTNTGLIYSGCCELHDSNLVFSENMPFIKVEMPSGRESVIVLPEGDGFYYMALDKKESADAARLSIIGNPLILKERYLWLLDHIDG